MRSSKSRSRTKSNRQRSVGNIINRVFDSSGPEGKVRGTPQQIIEKYLMLARDAQLSNDRVAEQSFLQHAEHYTRLLGEAQREMAREQDQRQPQFQQGQGGNGNGNGYGSQTPRERGDDGDQPDMTPLMGLAEEDGPGLVYTPEAQQPRSGEAGGRERSPRSVQPPRNERSDQGTERAPRHERPDQGAERTTRNERSDQGAEPATRSDRPDQGAERPARTERPERAERQTPDEAAPSGAEPAKEKPARSNTRSRGPRKPRPQSDAAEAPQSAPEPTPDAAQ